MNLEALRPLITRYVQLRATDQTIIEHHEEHNRRKARAQRLLTLEHLPHLTVDEWIEFLKDTDAARGNPWDTHSFWREHFSEESSFTNEFKDRLAWLISHAEDGLTAKEFNEAIASLPHIGPAYLSEMLALRFPGRYWMFNRVVRTFLENQDVDLKEELPWGKKGNEGELYMLAGRYLDQLRRALEETAAWPVDFMETDLFIYWSMQQDIWKGKVEGIVREGFPEQRKNVRRKNERQARELIEQNLGRFSADQVRTLFRLLNTDISNAKERHDRFMPALYGATVNRMLEDLDAFNRWLQELWETDDENLDPLLDEFWEKLEVSGAGISMPTAMLYLRNPERYTIWLPNMQEGLRIAMNFTPGKFRTSAGYRAYNDTALKFRRRYDLPPQALDLVLWKIWKDTGGPDPGPGPDPDPDPSPRFVPYTFENLRADTFLDETFWNSVKALIADKRQIILYGPPGTGKTWVAKQFARHWIDLGTDPTGEVHVVQFHPSYSYEEFVEGIRPLSLERPDGGRDISYEVRPGIFRRFCETAAKHPNRNYVLILDEVNRGEIARIFGELLYLLEYRDESVTLPYSGASFSVPKNVYVIGTMNSADRSIALVDHALRRRFHFIEMRPGVEALREFHELHQTKMGWTADLLEEANRLLKRDGIEWHLHIGHSHLMSRELDEARLRMIWAHSVVPTLQEYFYRQDERLQEYSLENLRASLGVE